MITYSGSCDSIPTRSSAARIAIAPSSVAGCLASVPPSFPKGVRTALTMTLRGMAQRTKVWSRVRRRAKATISRITASRSSRQTSSHGECM